MSEDSEEKIPYEPSQTKRFEISNDPISRERLQIVLSLRKELQQRLGGINIAITLFGSLSKGKSLDVSSMEFSDVDICIYFDIDDLKNVHKQLAEEDESFKDFFNEAYLKVSKNPSFLTEEEAEFKLSKRNSIPTQTSFEEKKLDFALRKATENFIYKLVRDKSKEIKTNLSPDLVIPIAKEGRYSIMGAVMWEHLVGLHHYFYLDVGGGMKRYRQAFMEQLNSRQDKEEIWQNIYEDIIYYERRNQVSNNLLKRYPTSFTKALEFYGDTHSK